MNLMNRFPVSKSLDIEALAPAQMPTPIGLCKIPVKQCGGGRGAIANILRHSPIPWMRCAILPKEFALFEDCPTVVVALLPKRFEGDGVHNTKTKRVSFVTY